MRLIRTQLPPNGAAAVNDQSALAKDVDRPRVGVELSGGRVDVLERGISVHQRRWRNDVDIQVTSCRAIERRRQSARIGPAAERYAAIKIAAAGGDFATMRISAVIGGDAEQQPVARGAGRGQVGFAGVGTEHSVIGQVDLVGSRAVADVAELADQRAETARR